MVSPTAGIDLHAHFVPVEALRAAGWATGAGGPVRVRVSTGWQAVPPALLDPGAVVSSAGAANLAVRVCSLPPFLLRHDLPVHDGIAYSRAMNDGLAAAATSMGNRVRMLATVPLQAPQDAVEELRRAAGDLGFAGVEIATNVAGTVELDDPALEPFWSSVETLRMFVLIHPHDVAGAARMQAYHLRNLVGNPVETTLAAARLIFGGVLSRHPDLTVVLSHGGGALPWLAGRIEQGYRVRPECRTVESPPSAWLRRFVYDTVLFAPHAVRALVEWVGADRVVLGTDYPFDMGDTDPIGTVTAALSDPQACDAVLAANAARLLALTGNSQDRLSRATPEAS